MSVPESSPSTTASPPRDLPPTPNPAADEFITNSTLTSEPLASNPLTSKTVTSNAVTSPSGQKGSTESPAPETDTAVESDRDLLGWDRQERRLFVLLIGLALLLSLWHFYGLFQRGAPLDVRHLPQTESQYRVEINTASWIEFALLPGIGESLARAIIADREQRGPFSSIDALERVRGIGPKKLAEMRRWLIVAPAENSGADNITVSQDQATPDRSRRPRKSSVTKSAATQPASDKEVSAP